MMARRNGIILLVVVFLLGALAGSGMGVAYGKGAANTQAQQRIAELENQLETLNGNYLIVVREYNKLFSLQGNQTVSAPAAAAKPAGSASAAPVKAAATAAPAARPAATAEPVVSEPAATSAPAAAEAEATPAPAAGEASASDATPAAASGEAGGALTPDFLAEAVGGTGPQEGPPPLLVRFTDKSTGTIASWKWDFGDGETSTEQNPSHTYKMCPGEKELCTVTLTVCDAGGTCQTATQPDLLWVSESCTGC